MAKIDNDLATVARMPDEKLAAEWQRVYQSEAPRLPPDLLRRGIAYRLQKRVIGRLPAKVARALAAGSAPVPTITAGTRLVREWNGRTIDVIASADGMVWEGRVYRSLSAIAREVTGTAWSGPRFFGIDAHG